METFMSVRQKHFHEEKNAIFVCYVETNIIADIYKMLSTITGNRYFDLT